MKIVKGDLYFYNKGTGCYVVKARKDNKDGTFSGTVVYMQGDINGVQIGEEEDCYNATQFIRLSNKITV